MVLWAASAKATEVAPLLNLGLAGKAIVMASVALPDLPLLAQASGLFELAAGLALLAGWQTRGTALPPWCPAWLAP